MSANPSQLLKLLDAETASAAVSASVPRAEYRMHAFQAIHNSGSDTVTVDIQFSIDGTNWVKWKTMSMGTFESYAGLIPFVRAVKSASTDPVTVLMHSADLVNEWT